MTKDTSSAATWLQLISPCHLDTSIPLNSTLLMDVPSGIRYAPFTFFQALGLAAAVPEDAAPVLPVLPVPAAGCPGPPGPADVTTGADVSPGPIARAVPAGRMVPALMIPAMASTWQRLIMCILFFIHFSLYKNTGDAQPSAVTSPVS